MVAQSSRSPAVPPPTATVSVAPEPKVKKKAKGGFLQVAKQKASGSLRKAFYGKQPKSARHCKDAEDISREEEEDCTQSNYDTVRSLPATGHYGRSRVGHAQEQRCRNQLRVQIDEGPPGMMTCSISPIATTVIRLPRMRGNQPATGLVMRISPHESTFDFNAWHSALDDLQSQDGVYSLFMKAHKCYDLIPVSSKLVVFDTHLPVRKAFFALVYNGVRAAPLWDSKKQRFVGMLTITDFIKILYGYKKGEETSKLHALEEQEISHWREKFEENGDIREMVSIDPNESLHRAVELLCSSKVHRLPVLDQSSGNISYILTHKRIMKFLSLYIHDLPKPTYMDKTPRELEIGSWGAVLTVHTDTPLIDALRIFLKNRVSALPLVDGEDRVVDIYAKFDVIALAADKVYENLDVTVHEALRHRSDWFEGVHCCRETDNLFTVLETIVRAEVHRLIVVDADRRVVGVVSLSDILKYLVLDTANTEPMEVCNEYTPPIFGTLEEETHLE